MDFNQRIQEKSSELVESLQELLRIRSVEDLGGGGYPFGAGVQECLEKCLALGKRLGLTTVNVDNMVGYCEYGKGDEMIAVLGHLDVVPEGDGWTHPPYGAEIENGRLYGRGAIDDKGPTVAALYALDAVRRSGVPLSRRIRVIFGLNEETGSAGVKHYVANGGEIPVMGFTPDAEYPIINGEKGIVTCSYELPLGGAGERAIISIKGGSAPNVVPDYACAELRYPADQAGAACKAAMEGEAKVKAQATPGGLRVEAWGVNAHGSTPEQGENAIGRLLLALGRLKLDGASGEFTAFMNRYIGMDTTGKLMDICLHDELSGDTTLNLGVIEGDEKSVTIRLNVRYPVTRKFEDFSGKLRGTLEAAGFTETKMFHKHSIYMPPESELIRKLSKVYEEQTGDKARLMCIGGGTYAKAIPNIVAFGPIFPGEEVTEHKPDEYIELEKLIKNTQIIAAAMYELAQ